LEPNIVETFHQTSALNRADLFEDSRLDPVQALQDAATAASGWVGSAWQPGSTVLVGINPGGGGDTYRRNSNDDELYGLLRGFRDATGERQRAEAFATLSNAWINIQRGHNIWRLIEPLLEALGKRTDEVAFLNILPFRTRQDAPAPIAVLKKAWEKATFPQIEALAPRRIIALGKKAHNVLVRLVPENGPELVLLKRTIGDSYLAPEAKAILEELRVSRDEFRGHQFRGHNT